MSAKGVTTVTHPYKFLDYYTFEERHIFFGRERETEILLSDIIATRLVVLFAKTGTGKTSLINAGVRPRLEELDYATFYIRVEHDPTESVRKALRDDNLLPAKLEETSLATQLEYAVAKLDKPVVVFFDQFEEFFIYILNEDPEKAQQFIADVAKEYRNRESGVHIVFSMREEYFVEMDAFRDEIPSIFHKDSNLRLRWFNQEQARQAIVGPAARFETEIDDNLVERLILELGEGRSIEPAQLQIVCDTLWMQRTDGLLRLGDYERLGGAKQILDRRLGDDLDENLDDGQLQLFERLLPELITKYGTKYVRGFDEKLVEDLDTDAATLRDLIDRLKALRLLRESTQYGAPYLEWTSDYLAERTGDLQKRVRAISLRRLLKTAMDRSEAQKAKLADHENLTDTSWIEATAEDNLAALYMSQSDFETISEGSDLLGDLNQAEAEFLFTAALEHGTHTRIWLERASEQGVDVLEILRAKITDETARIEQAENVVRLLGELRNEPAMKLLETALQQDALASLTLNTLADMETEGAMHLLRRALMQDALASQTIEVLRQEKNVQAVELLEMKLRQEDAFAFQAGTALIRIASGRLSRASSYAGEVLADVPREQAESLFVEALEQGLDMRSWFEQARENGVDVWKMLRHVVVSQDAPIELTENALRLLSELENEQAVGILESALQQERLASPAERALERISERGTANAEIKDRARGALERWRRDQGRPIAQPPRAPAIERRTRPTVDTELLNTVGEKDWALLLRRIEDDKCTPIIGAGAYEPIRTFQETIAREWAQRSPYATGEAAEDLARAAQFLALEHDRMYPKEEFVKRLSDGVAAPDFEDGDEPYRVLAELPVSVYLTTNYDDFMVQTLKHAMRSPKLMLCRWNNEASVYIPTDFVSELDDRPTPANPLVYFLQGHTAAPESLVLTEDDYVRFLVSAARLEETLHHRVVEALTGTSLMLIGFRRADWSFRVLCQGLLPSMPRLNLWGVAVILEKMDRPAQRYLADYFKSMNVRIFWGSPKAFMAELRRRWKKEGYRWPV
jgi:hypothetical protein